MDYPNLKSKGYYLVLNIEPYVSKVYNFGVSLYLFNLSKNRYFLF